jgi:hypothetical protein
LLELYHSGEREEVFSHALVVFPALGVDVFDEGSGGVKPCLQLASELNRTRFWVIPFSLDFLVFVIKEHLLIWEGDPSVKVSIQALE